MFPDLQSLAFSRSGRSSRSSSWDRTGANTDSVRVEPGESHDLLLCRGSGMVQHIWITVNSESLLYPRELVLTMHWDGADSPSVSAPLGDFFGLGHGRVAPYASAPFTVVTGGRPQQRNLAAFNCWLTMPFGSGARISLRNDGDTPVTHLYYYVDFVELPEPPEGALRFHAHYRQERPTGASIDLASSSWQEVSALTNIGGTGNYLLLDTVGRGHYLGCTLSVDHLNPIPGGGWFGEGDDMFFIDGRPGAARTPRPESAPGANDAWPPTLHGTGTEDYFCAAWGYPAHHHATPYHGVTLAGVADGEPCDYAGKWSMYRFHLTDPVLFESALRMSIEHGHANCHADDYSSVAYWYQTPLARDLPPLPPLSERLPRDERDSLAHYLRTR